MLWWGKLFVLDSRGLKVESPKEHRTHAETRMWYCTIYTFNEQNLMIDGLLD